jgi:hypothetical protein
MRQNSAHRFVEAAADCLFGNLEVVPGPRASGAQLRKRLLGKTQRSSGISLEIGARPVALNRIALLGNMPIELDFGQRGCLGQIDLDAVAGGLDIADVHQAGKRRRPETRDGAAPGIERKIVTRALVLPAG